MDGDGLAKAKRPSDGETPGLSTDWTTGRRTTSWNLLWARLFASLTALQESACVDRPTQNLNLKGSARDHGDNNFR